MLKYAYCHQMTTQTDPKGERRVSGKTNSRTFLFGTKRLKKENFSGFKAHGSGYMALASAVWVTMGSQVPVLSPSDPPKPIPGTKKGFWKTLSFRKLNSELGLLGGHGPGCMGLEATAFVPLGAQVPVLSPNHHPKLPLLVGL